MRKRLITSTPGKLTRDEGWLDVERVAVVEFTSEDKDYPVESRVVKKLVAAQILLNKADSSF